MAPVTARVPRPSRVAVLHTSFVFIKVEPAINDLIAELLPDTEVVHFVDSDVLATVVREGGISESSAARMVHLAEAAEAAGVDVIFSACSSLGPSMNVARGVVRTPIVKIDEAMATAAAELGTRIGVLATVPTTLKPTADLIAEKAAEAGREVDIRQALTAGAFDVLMSGDRPRHDDLVAARAAELAAEVDLIVLAQASMARLADRLRNETGRPVLSSPRLGVADLARRVHDVTS